MSDSAAPTYSIFASVRWFALIYVIAIIAVSLVADVLAQLGVVLPEVGVGIGIFAGVAGLAGQRFAQRREWTGRDRNRLSMGYMLVAIAISCMWAAALFFFLPQDFPAALIAPDTRVFLVGIVFAVALIYYGVARLILVIAARQRQRTSVSGDAWKSGEETDK